ncbi:hypothetical protein K2173_001184 [Erythroxylum novogranatense]|uniref:RNase H type-1 domain-containing protein n=1 Tax=Erythroxylum novogranatense TaxID=1862640 RepID=A0AAV8TL33_9ROSI|nr:hypothetical protein K2173_001184 [Erythroxylum novogranatense]
MIVDDTCSICAKDTETAFHVLYTCEFAQSVWLLSNVGWQINSSLNEWLRGVITSYPQSQQEEIFMLIWSLWLYRNEVVWESRTHPYRFILSRARTALTEWKTAKISSVGLSSRPLSFPACWEAPAPSHFKCNVDVALLENGYYRLGMIIRNSQGQNCAGKLMTVSGWGDPQVGEVLCFREALSWIKSLAFFPICMETDCQVVTQFLTSTHSFSSYFSMIINDCKSLIQELSLISFAFVRKPANQVAHTIARAANSIPALIPIVKDKCIHQQSQSQDLHFI